MTSSPASNLDKFVLLLWKNFIIHKRHRWRTLFEMALPVAICATLLWVPSDPQVLQERRYPALPVDRFSGGGLQPSLARIAYSPQNDLLEGIVASAAFSLGINDYQSFNSSLEMKSKLLNSSSFLCGIDFGNGMRNITDLPKRVTFDLRFPYILRSSPSSWKPLSWDTDKLIGAFDPTGHNRLEDDGGEPSYYREQFLAVQTALSKAIIARQVPSVNPPKAFVQRFANPDAETNLLHEALNQILPLLFRLVFMFFFLSTVKYITVEKENQLKESMKIMGLPGIINWAAWFVELVLLMVIPITLITIILKLSAFVHSNVILIWIFLLCYCMSTISLAFFTSVFFDKAIKAASFATLVWVASYFSLEDYPFWVKTLYSLLSNPAMHYGMNNIIRLEAMHVGVDFSTMFSRTDLNDPYNYAVAIGMFCASIFLYICLTLYLEQVMPGQYGIARPWYFPCLGLVSFKKATPIDSVSPYDSDHPANANYFEPEPIGTEAGVQIKNLRKVFPGHKVAVDKLNLNLYQGQITVLLGHNGAGKTTTMSMLTGMFSPSSGTATINGHDIRTDMNRVRSSMGLCPQHNVLFDELTVSEHLQFAARLKGVPRNQVHETVTKYINLLGMNDKAKAQSSTLSGGMKRKLTVGMALCGEPKVVLLDEPTTGVDPTARRALWDLLLEEKRNKTILLSTHFMNEADVLGDRIAILAEGKLTAAGSTFFLKSAFGVGYRLICVKGQGYQEERLLSLLRKFIPDVNIEVENASELTIILKKEYTQLFQSMLKELETHMEYCGVTSYGISLTTLEEVFLKAGSDSFARVKHFSDDPNREPRPEQQVPHMNVQLVEADLLQRSGAWVQLKSQILKKFIIARRSWRQFCWQTIIIPIGLMTFFLWQNHSGPKTSALDMSLEPYRWSLNLIRESGASDLMNQTYQKLFEGSHKIRSIDMNMDDYVTQKLSSSPVDLHAKLLLGASFTGDSFKAFYNPRALHSAPLSLNLVFNAMLKTHCPDCSIGVRNNPLPPPKTSDDDNPVVSNALLRYINLVLALIFIMVYTTSAYITFYIKERVTRAKLLQTITGLKVELYWLSNVFWDVLNFTITCVVVIIMIEVFQVEGWNTAQNVFVLLLFLNTYLLSVLPMIYLFSFMVSDPASGYSRVFLFNGIGAVGLGLLQFFFSHIGYEKTAEVMQHAFLLIPTISLMLGLLRLSMFIGTTVSCATACQHLSTTCTPELMCSLQKDCCNGLADVFSFSDSVGLLTPMLYLSATGVFCFVMLWCIEHNLFRKMWNKIRPNHDYRYAAPQPNIDSDVQAEKDRVSLMSTYDISAQTVVLQNLTKNYGPVTAVKWLSLATGSSECFGLLGINGAGKTTAFKMMTGDEQISSGEVWVKGIRVKENLAQVYRHIGYCPQFDALLDELTGLETLRIFAMLRGVPSSDVLPVALNLAQDLGLVSHLKKRVRDYSGGNKRKLSTALALIGNPAVIFLDEPTSGMDPGAKRCLWDVVNRIRDSGRTVILTTHSMEECEALCTRLAIMVNGEFRCLGSTQHLKNKFSGGFLLFIKMLHQDTPMDEKITAVKNFVEGHFEGAVLKENLQQALSYHIPRTDLTWSTVFGIMESAKEQLGIEEYSLGQTTLEQVFLYFTKLDGAW
ncbi:phospholipid-transporting ATPase ABCA1-like [Uranotaenia lowii]|uniref:phospholipid-transporting ATPase ABCA1-like n=1 Tax=Uranotaenia lowii TaxID=190385 RepID=UPI0024799DDD|nr:phospholipid-transporting ATPase ABCA1-like [Uranotaenia lowii]